MVNWGTRVCGPKGAEWGMFSSEHHGQSLTCPPRCTPVHGPTQIRRQQAISEGKVQRKVYVDKPDSEYSASRRNHWA